MNSNRDEENYSLLSNPESSLENDLFRKEIFSQTKRHLLQVKVLLITLIVLTCFLLSGQIFSWIQPKFGGSASTCTSPSIRREWRSLSRVEKLRYIDAVQCLRERPSRLDLNQSLYDDFPYVHRNVGDQC